MAVVHSYLKAGFTLRTVLFVLVMFLAAYKGYFKETYCESSFVLWSEFAF